MQQENKINTDLHTTAYLALCLNTFVFSFMLKRMLAFNHRIYGRRQREGGLSPGVAIPYLMTASAYGNGELSINQFLFIMCGITSKGISKHFAQLHLVIPIHLSLSDDMNTALAILTECWCLTTHFSVKTHKQRALMHAHTHTHMM